MWEYENYDEGCYCEHCDEVYPSDDFTTVPVDYWRERFACPLCGHVEDKAMLNDAYYELGFYLLSIADDDHVWPEYIEPLPAYDA